MLVFRMSVWGAQTVQETVSGTEQMLWEGRRGEEDHCGRLRAWRVEFQLSYFIILQDDAVKVLHSLCQQIWKTQQWPQDWKRSVFIPIPKKGNAKE